MPETHIADLTQSNDKSIVLTRSENKAIKPLPFTLYPILIDKLVKLVHNISYIAIAVKDSILERVILFTIRVIAIAKCICSVANYDAGKPALLYFPEMRSAFVQRLTI